MNATEAMERIEGQTFSALVNLASDFPTFLRILICQPEVTGAANEMKSEGVTLDAGGRRRWPNTSEVRKSQKDVKKHQSESGRPF